MNKIKYYLLKSWPLIILAVLGITGFYYNLNRNTELNNKIETAKQELEKAVAELSMSQARVINYHSAQDEISRYTKWIHSENNPQKLINNIREDASSNNVYLQDIEIDVPKFIQAKDNSELITYMKFRAVYSGDYYSLGKYIISLEKSPYLENIDEVKIDLEPGNGRLLRLSIRGALRVFDQKIKEWCAIDGT